GRRSDRGQRRFLRRRGPRAGDDRRGGRHGGGRRASRGRCLMAATKTVAKATRLPGPPELLPGCPDAVIDLQTEDGVALANAGWRYADAAVREVEFVEVGSEADPLGPGEVPNRTYDVVPHAQAPDFDDSDWREVAPQETMARLGNGRVSFNWYRIA